MCLVVPSRALYPLHIILKQCYITFYPKFQSFYFISKILEKHLCACAEQSFCGIVRRFLNSTPIMKWSSNKIHKNIPQEEATAGIRWGKTKAGRQWDRNWVLWLETGDPGVKGGECGLRFLLGSIQTAEPKAQHDRVAQMDSRRVPWMGNIEWTEVRTQRLLPWAQTGLQTLKPFFWFVEDILIFFFLSFLHSFF